jgi:hypothetical protein
VARQVGARAVEGHALTTLGTSLGTLGQLEEGIADLEQGRRIARELVDVDDQGRVHANLATVLDQAGRSADAVEVFLAGADMQAGYARWRQAEALLARGAPRADAAAGRRARGAAAGRRDRLAGPPGPARAGAPAGRASPGRPGGATHDCHRRARPDPPGA